MKHIPCCTCTNLAQIFRGKHPDSGKTEYTIRCNQCGDIDFASAKNTAIKSWYAHSNIPMTITVYQERPLT